MSSGSGNFNVPPFTPLSMNMNLIKSNKQTASIDSVTPNWPLFRKRRTMPPTANMAATTQARGGGRGQPDS